MLPDFPKAVLPFLSRLGQLTSLGIHEFHYENWQPLSSDVLDVFRTLPLLRLSLDYMVMTPGAIAALPTSLRYLRMNPTHGQADLSHPTVDTLDAVGLSFGMLAGLGAGSWPSLTRVRLSYEFDWTEEIEAACRLRGIQGFHGDDDDWIPVDLS